MRYLLGFLASLGALCLVLVVGVAALGYWLWPIDEDEPLPERFVLTLDLKGAIDEAEPRDPVHRFLSIGDQPSMLMLVRALTAATRDPRVAALLIDLSEADIGIAQAQELRAVVSRLRSQGKTVHAFAVSFEGSRPTGAYLLASAADRIFLQPSGMVVLRGVRLEMPMFGKALDELGVAAEMRTRHEYKGAAAPLTDATLPTPIRQNYQRVVDSLYSQATAGIASGRRLGAGAIDGVIALAPLAGAAAKANGLVDELAYRDEVREKTRAGQGGARLVSMRRYIAGLADYGNGVPPRNIAVVAVSGAIARGDGAPLRSGRPVTSGYIGRAIREAREDDSVAALLIRIDSPGGSYVASDSILRELRLTRAAGKPVVVSMASTAASGGYFVALAADHVVAQPATLTGSIGVVGGKLAIGELLERHGVTHERVSAGANTGMFSPFERFSDHERKRLDALLDAIYQDFTGKVGEARRLAPAELDAVARGRVFTGEDARQLGLVDVLGGYGEAIQLAREAAGVPADERTGVAVFPREADLLEELRDTVLSGRFATALAALRDLSRIMEYAAGLLEIVESRGTGVTARAPDLRVR